MRNRLTLVFEYEVVPENYETTDRQEMARVDREDFTESFIDLFTVDENNEHLEVTVEPVEEEENN